MRAFGASGVPSYFQPLKNVLRWAMQGKAWDWTLPEGHTPVLIKETLGPYTFLEATFNPFEVLKSIGYPLHSLKVMIIGREPANTWHSWRTNFGEKTRLELFTAACRQVEMIRQQAGEAGVPVTCCVYEALRDLGPEKTMQGVFAQLGLPYNHFAIENWDHFPAYGEEGSNIHHDMPEAGVFLIPHINDRVENASELRYYDSDHKTLCTPEELQAIENSGVEAIYATWRGQTYSQL
jgi:hypothetical protein